MKGLFTLSILASSALGAPSFKGAAARSLQTSCDASVPPQNGFRGSCNSSLASGSSCQPMCNAGYSISGPTRCNDGVLSPARCVAYKWESQAALDNSQKCVFTAAKEKIDSVEACQRLCSEEACLGVTYDVDEKTCMLCTSWAESGPCVSGTCEHWERNKMEELLNQLYTWPAENALTFPGSGLSVSKDDTLEDVMTTVNAFDQPTKDALLEELKTQELFTKLYEWPASEALTFAGGNLVVDEDDTIDVVMGKVNGLTADQKQDVLRELNIQLLLDDLYNWPSRSDFGYPNAQLEIREPESLEDVMTKVKAFEKAEQEILLNDLKVQEEADLYFASAGGVVVDEWLDKRENESTNYSDAQFRPQTKSAIIKTLLRWHYTWQADGVYTFDSVPIQAEDNEVLEDFMANKVETLTDDQKNDLLYELQSCDDARTDIPENGTFGDCPAVLDSGATCNPTCRAGYTPSGVTFCINGFLNVPTCVAAPCNARVNPDNGSWGNCPDSLPSGQSCQPTCAAGFTVVGEHSCFEGNLTEATCRPDSCAAKAQLIENGDFGDCPATLSSGQSCSPTCDTGFSVSGSHSCLNGVLTQATCLPNPCDLVVPANGSLGDCPASLVSGGSCQPQCASGFTVSGTATCLNGVLTGAACEPDACDVSDWIDTNGYLGECSAILASGGECTPGCYTGYVPSGSHKCKNGKAEYATCVVKTEDDDWWLWVIIGLAITAGVLLASLLIFLCLAPKCCGPGKEKVYVYRSHSQRLKLQKKREQQLQREKEEKAQNKV